MQAPSDRVVMAFITIGALVLGSYYLFKRRNNESEDSSSNYENIFVKRPMNTKELIDCLENRVQLDEGKRGIHRITKFVKGKYFALFDNEKANSQYSKIILGDLYKAATLLTSAETVVIITGFPCMLDYDPPTETDGPLGALAIARTLVRLGDIVHYVICR